MSDTQTIGDREPNGVPGANGVGGRLLHRQDAVTSATETHEEAIKRLSTAIAVLDHSTLWRRANLLTKRLFDIVASGSALVMLSPLLMLIGLAVRLESRGPLLFVQNRWGRGRVIRVLKFRTMHQHLGDASGVAQTVSGDPRMTRLGAFLRRTNFDELPQLYNVLIGEMSMVGPRCHPLGMRAAGEEFESLVPAYHLRHCMRPGMTGLAQMKGFRGPTVDRERALARIRYDFEYIVEFNFFGDLVIIAKTILGELRGGTGL